MTSHSEGDGLTWLERAGVGKMDFVGPGCHYSKDPPCSRVSWKRKVMPFQNSKFAEHGTWHSLNLY
jgi:hypothetical protein